MSFPDGVATFTLNFPAPVEMLDGVAVAQRVTVTPSTSVVWAATGTLLAGGPQVKVDNTGTGLSFVLPDPTQAGFTDGAGNSVTNWTWDILVRYFYPQTGVEIPYMRAQKTFAYIAGSGPSVNFTDLLTVSSNTGLTVSIPNQWGDQVSAAQQAAVNAQAAVAAINLTSLGGIAPATVDAKIAAQAATDSATYLTQASAASGYVPTSLGLRYRGNYMPGASYARGDQVVWADRWYVAKAAFVAPRKFDASYFLPQPARSNPDFYVDSVAGLDTNDGRTKNTPWKTAAKVAATAMQPGTVVGFKRGCTWRNDPLGTPSGTASDPIIFTAYGSAATRPKFKQSLDFTAAGAWTLDSGSTWALPLPQPPAEEASTGKIFTSGFESENATLTTGFGGVVASGAGTMALDTAIVNSGTKSAKITVGAATTDTAYAVKTITATGEVYVRAYVYADPGFVFSATSSTVRVIEIMSGGTRMSYVALAASTTNPSTLKVIAQVANASSAYAGVDGEIVPGTWNCFEIRYFKGTGGSDGGCEFWLNGVKKGSLLNQAYSTFNIDSIRVGGGSATGTPSAGKSFHIDDVAISSALNGVRQSASYSIPTTCKAVWIDEVTTLWPAASKAAMTAGSVYLDSAAQVIYAWLPDGSNPNGRTVEVASGTAACLTTGSSYVSFEDLHLLHSQSNQSVFLYNATPSTGVWLRRCEIGPTLGDVLLGVVGGGIEWCDIHDVWNGVAYPGPGAGSVFLTAGTDGTVVRYNRVANCYKSILTVNGAKNVCDYRNVVLWSMVNGLDHTAGVTASPRISSNNFVWHRPAWLAGHALDSQNGGDGWHAYNNVLYSDYSQAGGTNVELVAVSANSGGTGSVANVDIDNNAYWLAPGSTCSIGKVDLTLYATLAQFRAALAAKGYSGAEAHALNVDPLLASIAGENLTPLAGSPLLDAGKVVAGVTDGYFGAAPDVGLFEFPIA